jgi:hypothetical protein
MRVELRGKFTAWVAGGAVLLAAVAIAAPPEAAASPDLPGPPLGPEVQVPPGTRADLLLWKRGLDSANDLVIQKSLAERQLRAFTAQRLDARLAERETAAAATERQRLRQLRVRLGTAWKDAVEVLRRRWPVDPRMSCREPFHHLDGAMSGGTDNRELPEARTALLACLKKLDSVLGPLGRANRALAAATAEAGAELERADAGASPAGGPGP